MEEKKKKFKINKKELWRTIKFTLFSISAGVIQLVSFAILYDWAKCLPWWPAYLISIILSVIWNFTFNRKFTFKSANNVPLAMTLVLVYYAVFTPASVFGGKALEAAWGEKFGIVVTLLMMLINFVTEFLWDKFVVFRGSIDTNDVAKREQAKNAKNNIDELLTLQTTEEQKLAIQQMADLVEGRMTIQEFWELYQNSPVLQDTILNDEKLPKRQYIVDQFNKANICILGCRVDIYTAVNNYFARRNVFLKTHNSDVALYCKLLDLVPSYIDIGDGEFFANILDNAPTNLKSSEKAKWFREKIRRMFIWDKKKPSWIQPPQWPIIDNVPYVFSHQATAEEGYECYYFYDPNDKTKTIVVEQCE